jgi:tyrosyl-tRNA synthetase
MSKIITDEKLIDEILTRGVENIFPSREDLKKVLMSGKRIKLYCGYDPTSKNLHLGNAISANKLGQFQKLGHEVIFLIGDFTGMIGDPTDKNAARKKLTKKEVLENSENYQKQVSGYLKFDGENPSKILYNSKWSSKLNFEELVELSSNFTVQQLLQRDMFQERIKNDKPIYLHEFLYPLAQGYDSVEMDVDLEINRFVIFYSFLKVKGIE